MKKLVNKTPVLHIVIDLDYQSADVAAAEFVELHHPNIKKSAKQSDEWLKHVNDLVRSILSSMYARKFDVIKAYPSSKSYTYYIRFRPTDKQGDVWDQELVLQLELRDHVSRTHTDSGALNEEIIVKTYYLKDKSYRSMLDILKELRSIFDDLQKGDFDSFVS